MAGFFFKARKKKKQLLSSNLIGQWGHLLYLYLGHAGFRTGFVIFWLYIFIYIYISIKKSYRQLKTIDNKLLCLWPWQLKDGRSLTWVWPFHKIYLSMGERIWHMTLEHVLFSTCQQRSLLFPQLLKVRLWSSYNIEHKGN